MVLKKSVSQNKQTEVHIQIENYFKATNLLFVFIQ